VALPLHVKISEAPFWLVPAQTSMLSSLGTGHFEAVVVGRPETVSCGSAGGFSGVGDGVTTGIVIRGGPGDIVKPHGAEVSPVVMVE